MDSMIHVSVELNGAAAELVGHERLEYGLVPPATVGTLLELICLKYPELGMHRNELQIVANETPADREVKLAEGMQVIIGLVGT